MPAAQTDAQVDADQGYLDDPDSDGGERTASCRERPGPTLRPVLRGWGVGGKHPVLLMSSAAPDVRC